MRAEKGLIGELRFAIRALEEGFDILSPSSYSPFDVVLHKHGSYFKIQVKACFTGPKDGTFRTTTQSQNRSYLTKDVDFFAIYLAEIDTFYIIPYEIAPKSELKITKNGKWKDYKENFAIIQ